MSLMYGADEPIIEPIKPFLPKFWFALYAVVFLAVFVYVFPLHKVSKSVINNITPSPVAVLYLNALVSENPDELKYQFALVEQQIILGNLYEARVGLNKIKNETQQTDYERLQNQITWLDFNLNLHVVYRLKKGSYLRKNYEQHALSLLKILLKNNKNQDELKELGDSALSLNQPGLALSAYNTLLFLFPDQSQDVLGRVAATAQMNNEYKKSGDLYFEAALKTDNLEKRQEYIMKGLSAYQANSLFNDGIKALAQFHPDELKNEQLLMTISRFMLAAGKPQEAEYYIELLLAMPGTAK